MTLSTMCRLGVALVATVSAGQGDWESFAHRYAGDFYQGPKNGEFASYLHHGGEHLSGLSEYTSQHSRDRISEAREDAKPFAHERLNSAQEAAGPFSKHGERKAWDLEKQAASFDPAVGAATALAAVPAAAEQDEEVVAADNSQQAVHRAEAGLQNLSRWDEELKADLEDKNFSVKVAKSIVSKVQAGNVLRRAELESKFDSALHAMSEATNRSEVTMAEQAAQGHAKELSHLDDQERQEMRKTLKRIEKEGKRKTRTLWKQVRVAARQAYHLGMGAARAQRRAGVKEHIYERAMGDAEKVSEGLSGRAEHLAERAEDLVERQSGAVEHTLEETMDHLQDASQQARRERLQRAAEEAKQAKHTFEAQDHSTADNRLDHRSDKSKTKADEEEAIRKASQSGGHPSAFFALDEPVGLDRTVALCAMALVPVSSFLVLRCRREEVNMENPLLG